MIEVKMLDIDCHAAVLLTYCFCVDTLSNVIPVGHSDYHRLELLTI